MATPWHNFLPSFCPSLPHLPPNPFLFNDSFYSLNQSSSLMLLFTHLPPIPLPPQQLLCPLSRTRPIPSSRPTPNPPMGVWQGVAMDSLKFHLSTPSPTLLCPEGGPPLKRPYRRFGDGPPQSCLWLSPVPLDTPRHTPMIPVLFSTPTNDPFCSPKPNSIPQTIKAVILQNKNSPFLVLLNIGVRHGVSKGVKVGPRPPALWAGHP
jgi:hypothetical protein